MSDPFPQLFAHRLQSRPSLTAEAVTMARAIEHLKPPDEPVIDDPWAQLFLSPAAQRALAAWSTSWTGRTMRRFGPTGSTYVPLRHRFIDDHLLAALDAGAYRFADQLNGAPSSKSTLRPSVGPRPPSSPSTRWSGPTPTSSGSRSISRPRR